MIALSVAVQQLNNLSEDEIARLKLLIKDWFQIQG